LHDISMINIGVYDNDPDGHEKVGEETHGFIVKYTDGILYDGVVVDSVGDEAVIIQSCNDATFTDITVRNNLYSSADGVTGAGINIVNGCDNIVINGAHLFSDRDAQSGGVGISFETLDDVNHYGISNVTIDNVVIQNCAMGMRLSTGEGPITGLTVGAAVSISNCDIGVKKASIAAYYFKDISFNGLVVSDVHSGFECVAQGVNIAYSNNISFNGVVISAVRDTTPSEAALPGTALIACGQNMSINEAMISDTDAGAIFFDDVKDVTVSGGVISNINKTDTTYAAIDGFSAAGVNNVVVDGIKITNGKSSGIKKVSVIKNSTILLEDDDASTNHCTSAVPVFINNLVNFPVDVVPDGSQYIGNRFVYTDGANPGFAMINLTNTDDSIITDNYFEGTTASNNIYAIWARLNTSNTIINNNNGTNFSAPDGTFYFQSSAVGNVIFNNNIGTHRVYQVDLAATTALPPISVIMVESTGGGVTCTATPSIAAGEFIGQEMTILGEDDINHWTLQSGASFLTNLGAATRQLDVGSVLVLKWDGALWQEVLYSS
jgi:hypothetical protein